MDNIECKSKRGYFGMTLKENYLTAIHHGIPEQVPLYSKPVRYNVGLGDVFEKGPAGGGLDGFGCLWATDLSGQVPVPGLPVLTDITDWKSQVKFPDLKEIDWAAKSEKELAGLNRETQVMEYCMGNGPFERFLDLMGIEGVVFALMDEPGHCHDFLNAFLEYRLEYIEIVGRYYQPDFVVTFDDVAYGKGMFLSREQYQEFIKPIHASINQAVRGIGAEPIQHCCGMAESLIEDFIDEGAVAWSSVDPANDIVGLLQKYGKQIALIGGFDSAGKPAALNATDEMLAEEMHRVIDTYGIYGSFIVGNHIVQGVTPEETARKVLLLREEGLRYSAEAAGLKNTREVLS